MTNFQLYLLQNASRRHGTDVCWQDFLDCESCQTIPEHGSLGADCQAGRFHPLGFRNDAPRNHARRTQCALHGLAHERTPDEPCSVSEFCRL
jgi:hypothetical protein